MSQTKRKRKSGICRTCLNELESGEEFYSVETMISGFKSIAEIITDITTVPVNMNDFLPKNICSECYDNFLHMAEFRELIRASHLNLMLYDNPEDNMYKSANTSKMLIKNRTLSNEESEEFTFTVDDIGEKETPDIVQKEDNHIIIEAYEENEMNGEGHYRIEYYEDEDLAQNEEIFESETRDDDTQQDQIDEEDFNDEEAETLELHIDEYADDEVDENVCNNFKGPLTTVSNISGLHETYNCSTCNTIFESPYKLISHKKLCENSIKHPHGCTICPRSFRTLREFQQHFQTHCNKPRKFPCGACDVSFGRETALIEHLKFHVTGMEYKCLFCPKFFASNILLREHVKLQHCNFSCHCGKAFTTVENLNLHKKFSHQPSVKAEVKTCPFCEKSVKVSYFKQHILNHTK